MGSRTGSAPRSKQEARPALGLAMMSMGEHEGRYPECAGCIEHPDPACAACGRPRVIALAGPEDTHAITLCRSCWNVVKAIRLEVAEQREARQEAAAARAAAGKPPRKRRRKKDAAAA